MSLTVDDFDFDLPPELIAQHPASERRGSRLLHVHGQQLTDRQFADLPACLRATHVSLFDGTLQGLVRTDKPAFCFQGHPEASPGPHDIGYLFDRFTDAMRVAQAK